MTDEKLERLIENFSYTAQMYGKDIKYQKAYLAAWAALRELYGNLQHNYRAVVEMLPSPEPRPSVPEEPRLVQLATLLNALEKALGLLGSSRRDSINDEYDANCEAARAALLSLYNRQREEHTCAGENCGWYRTTVGLRGQVASLQSQLERRREEIGFVNGCPRCGWPKYDHRAHCPEDGRALSDVEESLMRLQRAEIASLSSQLERQREEVERADMNITDMITANVAYHAEITSLSSQLERLTGRYDRIIEALDLKEDVVRSLQESLEEAQVSASESAESLERLKAEQLTAEEAQSLLNEIPGDSVWAMDSAVEKLRRQSDTGDKSEKV